MLSSKRILLLVTLGCSLVNCSISIAETLEQKLYDVDKLRAGLKTPFDEVDKRCNELLQEYTEPNEQGKIYFELVQVEGQSGFQRPEKILEFINKALSFPQEPLKKIRLYAYWGDALQVSKRGVVNQEMMAARREAAIPYLQGLKETLQYNLPEKKPEIPMGIFINVTTSDENKREVEAEVNRRMKENGEAQKKAIFQGDMINHREILTSQISGMYSRFPWASNEIRELATKILGDTVAVNRLMSSVDGAVQKRAEELGWAPLMPDNSPPLLQIQIQVDATVTRETNEPNFGKYIILDYNDIFIPQSNIAQQNYKAFILGLASGELLNPDINMESGQASDFLLKLGKGDLAWDGSLIAVRKAKIISADKAKPLQLSSGQWCDNYKLPDNVVLPYSVIVTTSEDETYLVTINRIQTDGIRIRYKKLSAEEVQKYLPINSKN
jgi:hypothetical protein